ncbi:D-alanyl-D-alanine carboxypeptidase family protein [Tritonibacter multivorans]|nr:D-alanyl-D-alanine carboxypeptidase family protein [Tritonibacter multivorans]MDA7419770.1 D-alanyl-D-alanine carboxypeptidase [Tritonibacter multivorans]
MAVAMRRSGAALLLGLTLLVAALTPSFSIAAPYAAMVMDARTGKVLHSRNADTRLHPASLTKMMTLYIAFEAVRNGEISLDKKITISRNAAAEPPSELGLRTGQKIALRYLLRAAAVKSANDAATAIGEAISGSEAAFARRMTRTAKSLGMTRTTFKNAHGLTAKGHQSTARDMTILGRHILYDYPEYYNLFSRTSTDAGLKVVYNTNRRLLGSYRGADGIKTGYTRAAGYNLVASAKRGNERIIATVFGGKSTPSRNAKVAELLDLGFRRAPSYAKLRKPALPRYTGNKDLQVAAADPKPKLQTGPLKTTIRPRMRPSSLLVAAAQPAPQDPELQNSINSLLAEVSADTSAEDATEIEQLSVSAQDITAPDSAPRPIIDLRPRRETAVATAVAAAQEGTAAADTAVSAAAQTPAVLARYSGPRPRMRPTDLATRTAEVAPEEPVLVTRISTSGGRYWGINVGRYASRYQAEKVLLRTALSEMETLDGSLRKVVQSPRGFDAHFLGMTQEGAESACSRLRARNVSCDTLGPS